MHDKGSNHSLTLLTYFSANTVNPNRKIIAQRSLAKSLLYVQARQEFENENNG